jgi:hypothetical protein
MQCAMVSFVKLSYQPLHGIRVKGWFFAVWGRYTPCIEFGTSLIWRWYHLGSLLGRYWYLSGINMRLVLPPVIIVTFSSWNLAGTHPTLIQTFKPKCVVCTQRPAPKERSLQCYINVEGKHYHCKLLSLQQLKKCTFLRNTIFPSYQLLSILGWSSRWVFSNVPYQPVPGIGSVLKLSYQRGLGIGS